MTHRLHRRRPVVRDAPGHRPSASRPAACPRVSWSSFRSPLRSRSSSGWRASYLWLGIGLLAIVLPIACLLPPQRSRGARDSALRRDGHRARPRRRSRRSRRRGASPSTEAMHDPPVLAPDGRRSSSAATPRNGMVLTHFMPHALEHNFTEIQASTALGVMGAMNVRGDDLASGWICDRARPARTAGVLTTSSAASRCCSCSTSGTCPSLHVWAALFGLNYISTVPPTTTLTANIYGRYSVGELSGWIFFSHQVGPRSGRRSRAGSTNGPAGYETPSSLPRSWPSSPRSWRWRSAKSHVALAPACEPPRPPSPDATRTRCRERSSCESARRFERGLRPRQSLGARFGAAVEGPSGRRRSAVSRQLAAIARAPRRGSAPAQRVPSGPTLTPHTAPARHSHSGHSPTSCPCRPAHPASPRECDARPRACRAKGVRPEGVGEARATRGGEPRWLPAAACRRPWCSGRPGASPAAGRRRRACRTA